MTSIQRIRVQSTSLRAVGFDAELNVLEVEFQTGHAYRYYGVTRGTFESLMAAESKGRYFATRIATHYRGHRID